MAENIRLNEDWEFRRSGESAWRRVELPHSPFVADADGNGHWFGECEYRRRLGRAFVPRGHRAYLYVGAAMHTARVYLDGREMAVHRGGYLPFEVDLTAHLDDGSELLIRVDNREDEEVPPGKKYDELDFCWYGGLYREVELRIRPPVHVTDPVAAGETAGGGVFVRTLEIGEGFARIWARVHVRNSGDAEANVRVALQADDAGGEPVSVLSPLIAIAPGAAAHVERELVITRPRLWSPATPLLSHLGVTVLAADGTPLDFRRERFGIRRVRFSRSGGLVLNGRTLRLRGTNRHQEVPGVGYAVPRAAQYRDARRIKEAGFDYVRLSHYPQSPDFLDACDELGIVVMNCLPGWQCMGGPVFREACYSAAREMIRRDRNHPCVVLWELSLNETEMDDEFMTTLHAIGHEEYPGDQMYTCGWVDRYDVFIHSRQHGRIHTWANGDKAMVIAEYGDWEFYARNEGFDQKTGAGVFDAWSTSRQRRGDGERGLRQQLLNHCVALNDTLSTVAPLDGQWAMFDYARGYDPRRAACGIMDAYRWPKFSYYLYRSQRDATEGGAGWHGGPLVWIASHWTPTSALRVIVCSNCDEVELRLNGTPVVRGRPAHTNFTQHLPHPPFVFDLPQYVPGTLTAVGFIAGRRVAAHEVSTPGAVASLELVVVDLEVKPAAGEPDVLFAHAVLRDHRRQVCGSANLAVTFEIRGAEIVGADTVMAEGGIASVVVRLPARAFDFDLAAHCPQDLAIVAGTTWRRADSCGTEVVRPAPKLGLAS